MRRCEALGERWDEVRTRDGARAAEKQKFGVCVRLRRLASLNAQRSAHTLVQTRFLRPSNSSVKQMS